MAIPTNKIELQNDIRSAYKKLALELASIEENLTGKKELPGHSKDSAMSINNLLSYLIGWGQLVLKWNKAKERAEHIDFPETGYKWNELGLLAQKFYKDFSDSNYRALCKKLDKVVSEILNLIDKKTNAELYHEVFYKEYTFGRLIQLNTASPYKNALLRIRKWRKQNKYK